MINSPQRFYRNRAAAAAWGELGTMFGADSFPMAPTDTGAVHGPTAAPARLASRTARRRELADRRRANADAAAMRAAGYCHDCGTVPAAWYDGRCRNCHQQHLNALGR